MLNLIDSFEYLKKLPVAKYKVINSESDLKLMGFPYFLKVNLSGHKVENGAVKKCNNFEQAKENLKLLRKKFPKDTILIQESVDGIEMIIGIKQDKAFGKLLLLGFGGTSVEVMKDITFITAPTNTTEIKKALQSLRLYQALVKRERYALDKLIKLGEEISKLNLKEADFNPVMVNSNNAVIVDARISV